MARILLIEDEDDLRAALREKLTLLGHQVDEAENGKVGLERFSQARPDLVITDILMPVMEGLETIGRLKRNDPTLKIVAMCGDGRFPAGGYLNLALKLGASEALAKPFSNDELERVLCHLLAPVEKAAPALTFLVVDDNVNTRFLNRHALEVEFPDSRVFECGSTSEALAVCCATRVDAVITDHHLGKTDGVEFMQQLRHQGTKCPVLMVTGSSDPRVHERAYQAGAAKVFFGMDPQFAGYLRETLKQS